MGEYVNQREWLENRAQCEAVVCTLGGQPQQLGGHVGKKCIQNNGHERPTSG